MRAEKWNNWCPLLQQLAPFVAQECLATLFLTMCPLSWAARLQDQGVICRRAKVEVCIGVEATFIALRTGFWHPLFCENCSQPWFLQLCPFACCKAPGARGICKRARLDMCIRPGVAYDALNRGCWALFCEHAFRTVGCTHTVAKKINECQAHGEARLEKCFRREVTIDALNRGGWGLVSGAFDSHSHVHKKSC